MTNKKEFCASCKSFNADLDQGDLVRLKLRGKGLNYGVCSLDKHRLVKRSDRCPWYVPLSYEGALLRTIVNPAKGMSNSTMENLSGLRFGNLLVSHPFGHTAHGTWYWLCRCDCGTLALARTDYLKGRRITSCGCQTIAYFKKRIERIQRRRLALY